MAKEIHGLMRVFKEKEYAEEFMKGNIRFGKLKSYKDSECIRKDQNESAIGNFHPLEYDISFGDFNLSKHMIGTMKMHKETLNDDYICCFSAMKADKENNIYIMPDRERLEKFGGYIVFIHKAIEFRDRLRKSLTEKNEPLQLISGEVIYKKFDKESFFPNENDEGFIKDIEYKGENEYRFKITRNDIENDFIFYNLGTLDDVAIMGEFKNLKLTIKDKIWGND